MQWSLKRAVPVLGYQSHLEKVWTPSQTSGHCLLHLTNKKAECATHVHKVYLDAEGTGLAGLTSASGRCSTLCSPLRVKILALEFPDTPRTWLIPWSKTRPSSPFSAGNYPYHCTVKLSLTCNIQSMVLLTLKEVQKGDREGGEKYTCPLV